MQEKNKEQFDGICEHGNFKGQCELCGSKDDKAEPQSKEVVAEKSLQQEPEKLHSKSVEKKRESNVEKLNNEYPYLATHGLQLDSLKHKFGEKEVENFAGNLYDALQDIPNLAQYFSQDYPLILVFHDIKAGSKSEFIDDFNGISLGLNSNKDDFVDFFKGALPKIEKKAEFVRLVDPLIIRLNAATGKTPADLGISREEFLADADGNKKKLESLVKVCEKFPEQFRFTDHIGIGTKGHAVSWELDLYGNLISLDIPFSDSEQTPKQLEQVLGYAKLSRQVYMAAKDVGTDQAKVDIKGLLKFGDADNNTRAATIIEIFEQLKNEPSYRKIDDIQIESQPNGIRLTYKVGKQEREIDVPLGQAVELKKG